MARSCCCCSDLFVWLVDEASRLLGHDISRPVELPDPRCVSSGREIEECPATAAICDAQSAEAPRPDGTITRHAPPRPVPI